MDKPASSGAWYWRIWPLTRLAAVLDERDMLRTMNELRLNRMSADEITGWTMELSHHVVPIIAEALAKSFEDHGGKNYVEFHCHSQKLGFITLTLQKRNGKTPHQCRDEAEAKAARLERELLELRQAVGAVDPQADASDV